MRKTAVVLLAYWLVTWHVKGDESKKYGDNSIFRHECVWDTNENAYRHFQSLRKDPTVSTITLWRMEQRLVDDGKNTCVGDCDRLMPVPDAVKTNHLP